MTNEEIREALEQIHFCISENIERRDNHLLCRAQALTEEIRELFFTDGEREQ